MSPVDGAKRFFKTPKGLFLIVLSVLLAFGAWHEGVARIVPGVVGAVVAAVLVDVPMLRWYERKWVFPDGAILTALIVAMLLSGLQPWYIAAITSVVGVASKYVFRGGRANVFNPAALALVVTFYPFSTAQNWWGALPDSGITGLVVLMATGVYMSARVNKLRLVIAFLGSYFLLFTAMAFLRDPGSVAEIYRTPDVNAALFFAFFMLTDPPTSPAKPRDQPVYALIASVVAFAAFEVIGAAYFLLAGLLAANVWEAARRAKNRRTALRKRAGRGSGSLSH